MKIHPGSALLRLRRVRMKVAAKFWEMSAGESLRESPSYSLLSVVRSNGIVHGLTVKSTESDGTTRLFFLPQKADMDAFRRGGNMAKRSGPSDFLPGCVGYMEFIRHLPIGLKSKLDSFENKCFAVYFAQASYRFATRKKSEGPIILPKPSRAMLPRTAIKYGHWKTHLFRELFAMASKDMSAVVFTNQVFRGEHTMDDLEQALPENYKLESWRGYYMAVPK